MTKRLKKFFLLIEAVDCKITSIIITKASKLDNETFCTEPSHNKTRIIFRNQIIIFHVACISYATKYKL